MQLPLLFTIILANFCGQGISSQSGTLKTLRPSSLRRDETGTAVQTAVEHSSATHESNLLTRLYRKEETIQVTGNGCISSPRFPNSYPRNLLLKWILDSAENTRIQLTFDSQFGLEEQENDVCRYDFVEVEESSETSSVVRGRWCGHREAPPRLTSKKNQIKITFKSDDHFVAKPGFKLCYSLVNDFPPAASDSNWESVTSPTDMFYHSPSVTNATVLAEALDQAIAMFDTVEEVIKHFNPETWQEDLANLYTDTAQYRGRTFQEKKSKVNLDRLNDDVKRYSCTPRNFTVNLREELKVTNAVFFPRCLLVKRCGGSCGCGTPYSRSCSCVSGKTVKKYHEVLRVMPEVGYNKKKSKARNMSIIDIQLEHHERCDCVCSSRPPR